MTERGAEIHNIPATLTSGDADQLYVLIPNVLISNLRNTKSAMGHGTLETKIESRSREVSRQHRAKSLIYILLLQMQ